MNMDERFEAVEKKVNDIHNALLGDGYGNNGFKHRLENLERKVKEFERKALIIYGASLAMGLLIANAKNILEMLTAI